MFYLGCIQRRLPNSSTIPTINMGAIKIEVQKPLWESSASMSDPPD
jgi:hypothetical protein